MRGKYRYRDVPYSYNTELREIPGYPGYKSGSDGFIYSYTIRGKYDYNIVPKKLKSAFDGKKKYKHVNLMYNGKAYIRLVHRLVCTTFHGEPAEGFEVSHLDGNKLNNGSNNLKWESRSDNHKRKLIHGTHDRGCYNTRAKLGRADLKKVRKALRAGKTHASIACQFGVSRPTITKISLGEKYAHE